MRVFVMAVLVLVAGCKKKSGGVNMSAALATMANFKDSMCACKDSACADKVQENMTKWVTEMASKARDRPEERASEAHIKKMNEFGQAYGECLTKLTPLEPAKPVEEESPIDHNKPPTNRQVDAMIRDGIAWSVKQDPARRIRRLELAYVDRQGELDPKFGDISIYFGRVNTEKRRIGTPTRSSEHFCYKLSLVWGDWRTTQEECRDTVDYVPHCTVVAIWGRALEKNDKVNADAVASIVFDPEPKQWTFSIDDEPTNLHVRETLEDDCPLTVEASGSGR